MKHPYSVVCFVFRAGDDAAATFVGREGNYKYGFPCVAPQDPPQYKLSVLRVLCG